MNLSEQLKTPLTLVNGEKLPNATHFVLGGMGGSRLPAEFFRAVYPKISVQLWKSYGLPLEAPEDALYVASSYSGETKETLSFFEEALARGLPLVAITGGGTLLGKTKDRKIPHIVIPFDTNVPARRMLPVALRALSLIVMKKDDSICEGFTAAERSGAYARGALLSGAIPAGATPVFYASEKNAIMAEHAKIEVAETAHTPASANVFPEFLHNELAAYARENTHTTPVFIFDPADDERAVKDARHAMRFLEKKGYAPVAIELTERGRASVLAENCLLTQGLADALARDRVPTSDFMREFRKEE